MLSLRVARTYLVIFANVKHQLTIKRTNAISRKETMGPTKNTIGKLEEGVLIHLLSEQADDGNHPAHCAEQRSHC